MQKKIAIIGTVGLPSKYGGFETLTEYLTKYLHKDLDITVYCSAKSYDEKPDSYNNAKLEYINLNANGVQSIPYDIISIFKALNLADTLLILGVSGCVILPFVKLFSRKKIVVNIDGLEWKRAKWNKQAKWFLKFSEKMAVKYADKVVTDNKVIQEYVESEYGKESELIAYGADHVEQLPLSDDILKEYPFLEKKYAFTVCRIEPENNIHMILEALSKNSALPYVIIGNWSVSTYGEELKKNYAHYAHLHLLDPIYDQEKLNQIRSNAHVYIHGHSAGGTNPSLVEAMALGLAVVAYGVNYNKETTGNKALYFLNAKELSEMLNSINEETLQKNAKEMKALAQKQYVWSKIAKKYYDLM